MKKDKKILTVVISLLIVTIFAGPKVYRWYKPYHEAKDMFGIDVPLTAKVTWFDQHYYYFDGSGSTRIVFDVSNLKKEMEQLLAEKNFIRSDNEELKIQDPPQFKTFFTDKNTGLSLGLKGGYYLPFYEATHIKGKRVVIYNPAESTLIF